MLLNEISLGDQFIVESLQSQFRPSEVQLISPGDISGDDGLGDAFGKSLVIVISREGDEVGVRDGLDPECFLDDFGIDPGLLGGVLNDLVRGNNGDLVVEEVGGLLRRIRFVRAGIMNLQGGGRMVIGLGFFLYLPSGCRGGFRGVTRWKSEGK